MSLRSYIITRVLLTIPMIMFLLTLVFIILRVIPGDPALLHFEKNVDPEVLETFRARLGLDKPLLDQYFDYLGGLLQGDFGESMADYAKISTHISGRFPATLELTIFAMLFAVIVGVILGVRSSKNYNTATDTGIRLFGIVTYAIPVFFLGMILQMVFSLGLHWLPSGGRFNPRLDPPEGPTLELWSIVMTEAVLVGGIICLAFFLQWRRTRGTEHDRGKEFWLLAMVPVILSVMLPYVLFQLTYAWWPLIVSLVILVDSMILLGILFHIREELLLRVRSKFISFRTGGYFKPAIISAFALLLLIPSIILGVPSRLWTPIVLTIFFIDISLLIGAAVYLRMTSVDLEKRTENIWPTVLFILLQSLVIIVAMYVSTTQIHGLILNVIAVVDIILLGAALTQIRRKQKSDEPDFKMRRFWITISGSVVISLILPVLFILYGSGFSSQGVDLTTGLYTFDSLLSGDWESLAVAGTYLILPSVTLGTVLCGVFIRLTRTNMLETLRTDFVVAGEARGLSDRTITYGYALKNAFLPIMTMIGLQFAALLAGAVLTETTFNWKGLGTYLIARIGFRDYTGIQGTVVFFGIFVTMVTLVMDILYAYLDPRIRL